MAGIGFELKKLFRRKGLFASLRAYGYAGIICTGPMLLGVALQMGILLLCGWVGAERAQQDLLVCMITYTLLFSLTVTSFFSMPVTRYLADMLYEEREQAILPSFWGSSSLMLVLGCSLYGLFLLVSGATLLQGLLCLWLFAEMIVNWNGMSYLTAIKDYRGILCSFLAAIGLAFGLGLVLVVLLGFPVPEGMLFAVAMGYGLMMVWDVVLLYRYFPQSDESPWTFLKWVDEFLPLAFTGLCTNIGLFAHLVICWVGPVGVQVKGLFYGAPYYDVPALIAFLTILITSINFVVSVEVNFYPKYRDYYSLFNDGGVVGDIVTAEEEMLAVLNRELRFTALKQLFVTAAVLSLEGTLLDLLPLGFNDLMHGYFRTLCVGYGLYVHRPLPHRRQGPAGPALPVLVHHHGHHGRRGHVRAGAGHGCCHDRHDLPLLPLAGQRSGVHRRDPLCGHGGRGQHRPGAGPHQVRRQIQDHAGREHRDGRRGLLQ